MKNNEGAKGSAENQIDLKLQEITNDLVAAAKHLLVPIKSKDDEDYDDDSFNRGSDV